MKLPVQAEKLLPHRGKMLLIDTVLSVEDGAGTVIACPDRDSISRSSEGKIIAPFFVELLAQSYAAVCGYDFISRGLPVPEGYLVGVQKFELHPAPAEACARELLISVETVGDFDGFAVVQGKINCNEKILAEGKIKLFVPYEGMPEELAAMTAQLFGRTTTN